MAAEPSSEPPANPPKPAENPENSAPPEGFLRAIEAYRDGATTNNKQQMEAAALNALLLAAEAAQKNPSPSILLKQEAAECETRGDWAGAETCRRKVLAAEEATGKAALVSKAHQDLSRLFLLLGDLEQAAASAQAATAAARQADLFPVLVMALENEVVCALRRSDSAAALEAAETAVKVVKDELIFDGLRAGALVTRARCRLAAGDLVGAESDLASSRSVLVEQEISPLFAGAKSRTARWWEVTAALRTQQRDLHGACEACAETVKIHRHVASLPQASGPYPLAALARALERLGEALNAAGKSEGGQAEKTEARRIWSELGLPEQA
jgi:tetratricopeptide (TPR) repeat protein